MTVTTTISTKPRRALFFSTPHCRGLQHCSTCRTNPMWRMQLLKKGLVPCRDFACPYGWRADLLPQTAHRKLAAETAAWARANMPCCNGGTR